MCIRDSVETVVVVQGVVGMGGQGKVEERYPVEEAIGVGKACLLYTSDAADERSSVDIGGRRIIKNKT